MDQWYTPLSSPRQTPWEDAELDRTGTMMARQKPMMQSIDPTFLAFFYHHVVAAAHSALNETGLWSHFQIEGITLVGGAVLPLYELPLPSEIMRTSDIDLTWYLHASPLYPNRQPWAVESLGDAMRMHLIQQFTHPAVIDQLSHVLPQGMQCAEPQAEPHVEVVATNRVEAYGSYSLVIHYEGCPLADLTLHDGFGSQTYDEDHHPIAYPKSVPMWSDPMYPREQYVVTVVKEIWPIRIPTLEVYVRQQLFAAGNLLLSGKEKGYRVMERVIHLIRTEPSLISLLLEKLMMLQKWPGNEERMQRIKPMLQRIKTQLERLKNSVPMHSHTSPHVPYK